MAEGSSQALPGPYFYRAGGKTYASLPTELLQGIRQCLHYKQMLKDVAAKGVQIPENILAQDPKAHILTPQQYLKNVEEGKMPPMSNHNLLKEMAEKAGQADQTKFIMMDFRDQARHPSTSAQEVSEIAIQTESCDTIYVTKDTLVTYTIAIVQNTLTLQFDQMQVALQTAQNHASIETPLKAEQLMTAHFNLAILMDNIALNSVVDAPASEISIPDPRPTAFASEEETICKTPHPNSHSNKCDRSVQLTTAVLPTYRVEPGPVRGISVGYESDNSWDFSDAGKADCT